MNELFRRIAKRTSDILGTWQAFAINTLGVLIWLAMGPFLNWSDTWQLWCNTFTTVVTYLLVFLLLNTQARDTTEGRIKLDAIILALQRAPNHVVSLSDLTEEQIAEIRDAQIRAATKTTK